MKIFLSYGRVDEGRAAMFAQTLRSRGISVWIDLDCLDCKGDIPSQLVHGVASSDVLALYASPRSQVTPWMRFELAVAVGIGRRVVHYKTLK